MAWLVGVFGVMAVVLVTVGLYGVLAYAVSIQAREIGIRMALGATPPAVRRLFVWRGLVLAAVGLVLGLAASFGLSHFVRAELFDVSPADPLTLVGTCAVLVAVAILASAVPAIRATQVDPLAAMRQE